MERLQKCVYGHDLPGEEGSRHMFTFYRQAAIVLQTHSIPDGSVPLLKPAHEDPMKNILVVSALLLLISGNALAGVEYDRCVNEEKSLKAQEVSNCGGLRYLLNPSGCFATRKALKEYASGKCKEIGTAESVDFSVQKKVVPEKKYIGEAGTRQKRIETELPQQATTIEQLKEENARLKAEIIRLKTENEQLRKAP
jgi:hypothetical protein